MAKKKKVKAEDLLTTAVSDLVSSMAAMQHDHREAFSQVQQDVVDLVEAIKQLNELKEAREAEIKQLHGAEKKLDDMAALEREYQEAVAQHKYELDQLKRQYGEEVERFNEETERKKRKRAWTFEDEDRTRSQALGEQEAALVQRAKELQAQAAEIGTFEERVARDVAKQTAAIKREYDFKAREAAATSEAEMRVRDGILSAKDDQIADLTKRLASAERARDEAQARAAAIATSALDKEAGAQALQELRQVAHKQAEGKK